MYLRKNKLALQLPLPGRHRFQVRTGFGTGHWQVFGLTGEFRFRIFLLTSASQPVQASAYVEAFVPVYRCGAVLDSHQIPCFHAASNMPRTNSTREVNTFLPALFPSRALQFRHAAFFFRIPHAQVSHQPPLRRYA